MNETELDLAAVAAFYCKKYEDSNPDVGMGPFFEVLIERVLIQAGVPFVKTDIIAVKQRVKELFPRVRWFS